MVAECIRRTARLDTDSKVNDVIESRADLAELVHSEQPVLVSKTIVMAHNGRKEEFLHQLYPARTGRVGWQVAMVHCSLRPVGYVIVTLSETSCLNSKGTSGVKVVRNDEQLNNHRGVASPPKLEGRLPKRYKRWILPRDRCKPRLVTILSWSISSSLSLYVHTFTNRGEGNRMRVL